MKTGVCLATLALLAGVCFLPAAELPCASAESMQRLMEGWTAGFNASHPEVRARVALQAKFSANFIEPLARGEVKVATFARELFPAEQDYYRELAGESALLVPVGTGSQATKGGTHAVVFFVHENNPLERLSLTQLREILADDGHITEWGQLGLKGDWAGRKINLHGMRVRRESGNPPGIVNYLETRLLKSRFWRADMLQYDDKPDLGQSLEQIVRAIAADKWGIGFSGLAYATSGVKALTLAETDVGPYFGCTPKEVALRQYPLTRTIYLGLSPQPEPAALAFVEHVLSSEGQHILARDRHGFIPLTEAALTASRTLLSAIAVKIPRYKPAPLVPPAGERFVTSDGAVSVVGYNDMLEMLTALAERFAQWHPNIRFEHQLKGTRTAPPALARGDSAFAPMGAEFSPTQLAEYKAETDAEPLMFRIAHCSLNPRALSGPLAIIVHPDNPLLALSLDEVTQVFSGLNSRGMNLYGLNPETALGLFMRNRTLADGNFAVGFRGFPQSHDVVAAVAADPRGIGFTAAMRVTADVKTLALAPHSSAAPIPLTEATLRAGVYPLGRHLLVYTRQPLEPLVREYLRFILSREGQEVIAAGTLGYLPLSTEEIAAEWAKLNNNSL